MKNNSLNAIKLYSFSNSMDKLYIDYENDNFPIKSTWQKELYNEVMQIFNANNLVTMYSLLQKSTPF